MFTEKQIAYAEGLRKKAHKIVDDAKEATFQHPAFTESKRASVEANTVKLNAAIDKMDVGQILEYFTCNAVKTYCFGMYANMNTPLREVMATLKICKVL